MIDPKTQQRLLSVHPVLRERITQLIENGQTKGFDIRVVSGHRNEAEQNALYAQGRQPLATVNQMRANAGLGAIPPAENKYSVTKARALQSNHNFGLAVDCVNFKNGKPDWEDLTAFRFISSEGKRLGLESGADWKFLDRPHLQLRGLSIKECALLYRQGGLPKVWEKMNQILKGAARPQTFTPAADDLLEFGDNGAEVTNLQNQLVELGFLRDYEVDGDFGKITKNAVIGFQRQNNLTADGIVGDGTKARLAEVLRRKEGVPVNKWIAGEEKENEPADASRANASSGGDFTEGERPKAEAESGMEEAGKTTNQTAENIINQGSPEITADQAKIDAAKSQPPVQIAAPEPTDFVGKVKNLVYGVATGTIALPFLDKVFGIQLSPESVELLKVVFPYVFFGVLIALIVWFVTKKVNNYFVTKLIADKNADVTTRNVQIVPRDFATNPPAAGLWRRTKYALTGKPAYIWMNSGEEAAPAKNGENLSLR